ncbi:SH3 and multiple ankyrin repeat domains protein 3 isoform X4 [Harmonia axyridis]|uniref:SH3 and multiple ankyrin repeat domains protein 3 isoform X4 n=1 Tax=Harmonia axyridis TaxID=115357 RepID=UPI001E27948A|nr:SH3 and multiple ankyrin repeat domains protein 3 isoform X4 [Harmonia axyridis]
MVNSINISLDTLKECEEISPKMEAEGDRGCSEEGYLLVRIQVPELNIQKCLQFPRDQLVWDVKQQCLASLPKELKESFNYGLFSPPENGRAGKFLDEERRLGDYPFNGPVGYLELKYKRRVYKMISVDEKQLKSLHTRTNLRRFLEYVQNGQVEKVTKMCSKGLDPNFHCQDSGETPLTISTSIKKPAKVIIALVNGGALLDYRTKDGSTAMHRSVENRNLEAMKTLLELGASPNYKDCKGLTPLYLTVTHNVDPQFTECLLHDHASIGAQDLQGWQEVHQACKNGQLQHLEHLLFYGADMNAQNASGNTPLHVCGVNGQESCARQLLFRGADRNALNFANQNPYQVAVIAGNLELAEVIESYRQEDVVRFRGPPSYNPKRRSAIGWLHRAPSLSTLALPPSPCPSDRSSVPFSSASSSLSDGSAPAGEMDTASIVTVLALGVADKSLGDTSDIISDSSGVGTANSDTNCSLSMPGTTVVCIEPYVSKEEGHISIREGDILEVTGATDCGYLEGNLRSSGNRSGLFPAHCVQEVRLRHNIQPAMIVAADSRQQMQHQQRSRNTRVLGRRESNSKQFATTPRSKKYADIPNARPRTVVLHKGRKGFGFILRGAKATSPLMELTPSEKCPGLQYLDDVDVGGVADMAGLKKGDFLLEINNDDVSSASHEHVVDLIRKSGNLVQMTVVSIEPESVGGIPMSKSTFLPGGNVDVPNSRQYATLPRKIGGNQGIMNRSLQAPLPPRRDPKTTLSVGRARAKSMVAGLVEEGEREETEDLTKSSSVESIHKMTDISKFGTLVTKTASIRQRPISGRVTSSELEELFEKQKSEDVYGKNSLMISSRFQAGGTISSHPSSPAKTRVYASVAEMKRNKSKNTKVRFTNLFSKGKGELRRDFHSTPDLTQELAMMSVKNHRSQEDLVLLQNRTLPPTHPPPPPPAMVQMVKVDNRISKTEYDNLAHKNSPREGIISSFKPSANAKLYASPEDMKQVGYRSKSLPSHSARPQVRKSQSMRSNATFKPTCTSSPPNEPQVNKNNPYAQPIQTSRSNSSASMKDRLRKIPTSKSASNVMVTSPGDTPSIPEPDYSCSESEGESDEENKNSSSLASRLTAVQLQPVENSGNSNASGSSSGSSSVPPSFTADEIQKGRSMLKSSKSYPEDFLRRNESDIRVEDGDNSSSGVSSDQEAHSNMNSEYPERMTNELPSSKKHLTGLFTKQSSLPVKFQPPITQASAGKKEFRLPPPPEFIESETNVDAASTLAVIAPIAPPPQFSDDRRVTRVRIVGAVPKDAPPPAAKTAQPNLKHGRLHSQ